ncbi:MAG: efflux RND transporter periplasmic adaptor subunit [Gammaproteobacteria bacterium]|nr:efflux RND transporter periplasmic adaptor subunit [Gammaproteobacteria bacterium]
MTDASLTTRYAAAAALLVVAISGCSESSLPDEPRLRPVRYLTVTDDSIVRDRSLSGTLKSSLESRLSFKVAGTARSVPVQIGQRLQKGDLIAQLDAAEYALQVEQAQASLVQAEANERNAASTYERTKGLYANDNASRNDLDAARANAESAEAQVRAATKALEIARLNESYTRLYAETDCSIASIDVEVNENVAAGQQIAVVSCGDDFEVTLDVPESVISSIDEYTPVSITFGSIPGTLFTGEVTEIGVPAGSGSVAFPVVVAVNERHPSLRSGLAADVAFQIDSTSMDNGVVLPLAAVIEEPAGTFVFIAVAGETADEAVVRKRAVSLGELTQSGVEILDGLAPGDRVVTAGLSAIRDGQRVLIN